MMENKLWIGLCALLLLSLLMNVGSAELHDDVHATASSTLRSPISAEVTPFAPPADSLPSSSLNQTSHAAAAASNGSNTNPRSNDSATMNGESLSVTPQPKKNNDTNMGVSFLENSRNSTLQPPVPSSENHDPTSHISRIFTTASPPQTTHTAPANTATTTPPLNTTHHSTSLLTTDTITPSSQPAHPKAHSTTSSITSELPGVTPRTKSTTTTTSTQSASTPSTNSSQETHNSLAPTLTPPSNTSQSDRQVSETHPRTTITTLSSTFAQTKVHVNNPSQLNVGGDTETVSKSPTLDPLLAGLVSAFIITAIIITLLLFLKLRRRDNRPEFRRLQDLPMDDMMEDTPLSMYSY